MKPAEQVKNLIRQPFAFPGGYPKFAITSDGDALCHECCQFEFRNIITSIRQDLNDGWQVVGVDINWEDPLLFCGHCNQRIESAYAEDFAPKT